MRTLWLALGYLTLLLASWGVQAWRGGGEPRQPPVGKESATLPLMTASGLATGSSAGTGRVAFWRWPGKDPAQVPLVLLHGSPGTADELRTLGELLAASGREVIAIDLPGFGDSTRDVPDYSIEAHARSVWALMDQLGLARVHVVGWSMSGGVVLHMDAMQPARLASMTMLGAIGDSRFEGSGHPNFEQFKYAVGYGVLVIGPKLLPHFGLLGDTSRSRSFIRNFWDTDMVPLRGLMQRVETPTLILHGRRDFLVPRRAAEWHHRLIGPSVLVMTRYSHFLPLAPPFGQAELTARRVGMFVAQHDQPGVPGERAVEDLAPEPPWFLGMLGDRLAWLMINVPVWVVLAGLTLAAWRYPRTTVLLAALLIHAILLDAFVAVVGLSIGGLIRWWKPVGAAVPRPWEPTRRRGPLTIGLAALGSAGRAVLMLVAALLVGPTIVQPLGESLQAPGLLLGMIPALLALVLLSDVVTRRGRWRLMTAFHTWKHHEFWPAWLFYGPLIPWTIVLALRHGPLAFLKANPAIHRGGGWVNESKAFINQLLKAATDRILPWHSIRPGPTAERMIALDNAMTTDPRLADFPLILKPDTGQRGFALRLARTRSDAEAYLASMSRDTIVQAYHPGPHECGILWIRRLETLQPSWTPRASQSEGFIFAVTRKTFPIIEGDGRRTLEELILSHPRLRCQAGVFLARAAVAQQRHRVLDLGERLRLAEAGNHCQGTMFSDGMDLVTPALEEAIDAIARDIGRSPTAAVGGFDFGRFDIRYESDELLRQGHGFGIVELNGTSSEATSLYDPSKGLAFAYGLLWSQWTQLFRLGAARGAQGSPGLTLNSVIAEMRDHYTDRPGEAVAD